jgi:DNA-binding XRE family transcriptional regulator
LVDRSAIVEARRALGRQLAALRKAAGYSQHEFAPLTHYARSTSANVEVGRQQSRDHSGCAVTTY